MSAAMNIKDVASMDRLAAFAAIHFPHRLPLIRTPDARPHPRPVQKEALH